MLYLTVLTSGELKTDVYKLGDQVQYYSSYSGVFVTMDGVELDYLSQFGIRNRIVADTADINKIVNKMNEKHLSLFNRLNTMLSGVKQQVDHVEGVYDDGDFYYVMIFSGVFYREDGKILNIDKDGVQCVSIGDLLFSCIPLEQYDKITKYDYSDYPELIRKSWEQAYSQYFGRQYFDEMRSEALHAAYS